MDDRRSFRDSRLRRQRCDHFRDNLLHSEEDSVRHKKEDEKMKARYESFGGIISVDDPPALAFVDKDPNVALRLGKRKRML